jgi:hypothetical protein
LSVILGMIILNSVDAQGAGSSLFLAFISRGVSYYQYPTSTPLPTLPPTIIVNLPIVISNPIEFAGNP